MIFGLMTNAKLAAMEAAVREGFGGPPLPPIKDGDYWARRGFSVEYLRAARRKNGVGRPACVTNERMQRQMDTDLREDAPQHLGGLDALFREPPSKVRLAMDIPPGHHKYRDGRERLGIIVWPRTCLLRKSNQRKGRA